MFDINSLLEAVGIQNERQAELGAQITGNYSQIEELGDQRAQRVVAAGENDVIVSEQKMTGELQAQKNARDFATSIGSNMDVSTEVMTSLGLQYRDAAMEAIRAQEIVREKQSVGLMDDPLAYIVNQITIGDDINYATAAQAKADRISTSLASINNVTQSTTVTQNAIAATKSAAAIEAATESIRMKAADQADAIKQQNLQFNIQGLEKLNQLNQNQLSNLFSAKSAINADKQLEMAQQQLAQSRKSFALQLEERQARIDAKTASQKEIEELGATINRGRAQLNLPPIPAGRAIQMMKMGGETGDAIKHQYTMGAAQDATGISVISEAPGRSAILIASTQAPLAPGMKPVRDLLVGTLSEVAAGRVRPDGQIVDVKDKNAVVQATNTQLKHLAKQQAGNIKVGDNNNIYQAPDLPSIIKTVPAVADTALYKNVLGPLINTGMQETNPTQLIALTAEGVAKGTIDFNTASSDLVKLFSAAAATNNATRDYVRVGLPKQVTYNTTVQIELPKASGPIEYYMNAFMPITDKVNMLDPTQVNHILSKQLRAKTVAKIDWSAIGAAGRIIREGDRTTPVPSLVRNEWDNSNGN